MNINWERDNNLKCSSGLIGYSGKYIFFSIIWDCMRSKASGIPPYKLITALPGVKRCLGNFESEEDAKKKAESVLEYWVNRAGIKD